MIFHANAVLLTFSKNPEIIISSLMFLDHQSILELFLKDHVTLKTGVMMLKIRL